MQNINRSETLKKYIAIGRKETISNLDGDDRIKLISEVFILKPNTQDRSGWREYERMYYKDFNGRGMDCWLEEGKSYLTVSGCVDDFIDFNFQTNELETNEIRYIKTYPNKSFMKRDRETSCHKERNFAVDGDGNVFTEEDE